MANKKLVIIPAKEVELFRQQSIRRGRDKIIVRGSNLRRDMPPPFPWEWKIIVIAAIGFFAGLVIAIIVYLLFTQIGRI